MPYTGKCSCGNIQFTVDGEPMKIALCHCLQCRRLTGTAFTTNMLLPRDAVHITHGSPRHGSFQHEAGMTFDTTFCGDCGSLVGKSSEDEAFRGAFILSVGLLDEAAEGEGLGRFRPESELWVKYRAGWVAPVEGVVQEERF